MKTETKFLCLTFASTIAISTPLILTSCSANNSNDTNNSGSENNNPNDNNKPTPPSTVDTSNIKTFSQALCFAKDYLNKYYTLDMFKSDVTEYLNFSNSFATPEKSGSKRFISNITTNNDKTINFSFCVTNNSTNGSNEKYSFECKNFSLTPIIVKDPNYDLIAKIGLYVPFPVLIRGVPSYQPKPESDFSGARNNFILNSNQINMNYGWCSAIENQTIVQNKIYLVDYINPKIMNICFLKSFSNIYFSLPQQEFDSHLVK